MDISTETGDVVDGAQPVTRNRSLERLSSPELVAAIAKKPAKAIHDGGGLFLRPFKSGSWFWYLRATSPVTGKRVWVTIKQGGAPYPQVSLSDARKAARQLRDQFADGMDATLARKQKAAAQRAEVAALAEAERRAVSFRQVFDQWRATDLQPRKRTDGKRIGRKDGGQFIADQFTRYVFPKIGAMPFALVRRSDILAILDELKSAGKLRTANVMLADLKQLFRFAVDREVVDVSPIERIKKEKVGGKDVERDRRLSRDEIAMLPGKIASANLSPRTALGIWIILATGVRVGELTGAVWPDHKTDSKALRVVAEAEDVKFGTVNFMTREWFIPDTKNQREHTIHLSDFALEKFKALAELKAHDDWIFPASNGNKPVCVKSFGKQLSDRQREAPPMKNRSKAADALAMPGGKWTAHDLRRTAASLMASLGVSSDVINECLNHKLLDRMSRVYIHDRRETDQVIAFDKLGAELKRIESGETTGQVITLPQFKRTA